MICLCVYRDLCVPLSSKQHHNSGALGSLVVLQHLLCVFRLRLHWEGAIEPGSDNTLLLSPYGDALNRGRSQQRWVLGIMYSGFMM
jgi:hypothetical protein